jgi:hypothetical protein
VLSSEGSERPFTFAHELVPQTLLWPISCFTQTVAGIATAVARRWEAAEGHFQIALRHAESSPDRLD